MTTSSSSGAHTANAGNSLGAFLAGHTSAAGGDAAALASVIGGIAAACTTISAQVRVAGLEGVYGTTGEVNVQGEIVQKLDILSNGALIDELGKVPACAGYGSEEMEEPVVYEHPGARYVVVSDPLDGSSNIDVNVSIGTIFAVLPATDSLTDSFIQGGRKIAAAGWVVYGPSTVMVMTAGDGAHGFTLDPARGEFLASHESISVPARGGYYSINEGNSGTWSAGVKAWNAYVKESDKATGRPYSQRYVGSLVADALRTLLKGGIFAYPADQKNPGGKLRLVYEGNPMAAVFEAAGGAAIDGASPILDIAPEKLHARTPLVIGSTEDVETFRRFYAGE